MDISHLKQEYEFNFSVFFDPKFTFDEDKHEYRYDGEKFESVTTFKDRFKVPFDRDYWLPRKARERGVDVSVIAEEWDAKALIGTTLGSKVHAWIEDFWNGLDPEIPDEESEFKNRILKFMRLYELKLKNLIPLHPELKVFSKRWKLAGTIDQPFLLWDVKRKAVLLLIGDWKTDKEFKGDDHPKSKYKRLLHPFADLWENSINLYSIQICLYMLIIEDQTGIKADSGFLAYLGPHDEGKIIPIKDLRERLRVYLQHNRENTDIFDV